MKYWITIHSPHTNPNDLPWHVYLQNRYKNAVAGIAKDDIVFFYETKTSKIEPEDRTITREGVMVIRRVGYVTGDMYSRNVVAQYNDGETKYWSWGIPTNADNSSGFVARKDVVKILGYASNYYFRGFNGGTGIKQVGEGEARELLILFEKEKC